MEEYKDISRGLKMLLDKAEEMGWNWEAYIEPDNRRTYVEIGQSSPAGEDFSMVIDFDEENQADSFKDSLESYYEDFDIDEHIEMWIEAKRSGTSGVPSTRELVKDAEAIDGMILELSQALQKVNIPVLVGSYTPPDENGEGEKIVREFYGQGHIFKDEDAFYHPGIIRYGVHEKQHPAGVQPAGRFGRGSFRGTGLAARKQPAGRLAEKWGARYLQRMREDV